MTKLDTLKGMLRRWKLTHSIVDAADICEFLIENLDIHHEIDKDSANKAIDKISGCFNTVTGKRHEC